MRAPSSSAAGEVVGSLPIRLLDVVTSRQAISSDAKKGLGFVPDYQALTARNEAERRCREEAQVLCKPPRLPHQDGVVDTSALTIAAFQSSATRSGGTLQRRSRQR